MTCYNHVGFSRVNRLRLKNWLLTDME